MEMTNFDMMFMDTVTVLDQFKHIKLPFIKRKSGPEELQRNSSHNSSQIVLGK
jgi:hypothetical protein